MTSKQKNVFLVTGVIFVVGLSFIFGFKLKEQESKKTIELLNLDHATLLSQKDSEIEPEKITDVRFLEGSFDLTRQINEIPTNLPLQKNFECIYEYEIDASELSKFELKIYNNNFLNGDKKLGVFCKKDGNKVLASYTESKSESIMLYEQNIEDELDHNEIGVLKDQVGSVSLNDFKLISWDESAILFAARDTDASTGLQNKYMNTYYLDINSLGFSEPIVKILETCKYGISPGTSQRGFISCSKLNNQSKSTFLNENDLW